MTRLPAQQAVDRFISNEDRVNTFTNKEGFYETNESPPQQVETLPSLSKRLGEQEERLAGLNEIATEAIVKIEEKRVEVFNNTVITTDARNEAERFRDMAGNSAQQSATSEANAVASAETARMYSELGFGAGGTFNFGRVTDTVLIFNMDFGRVV